MPKTKICILAAGQGKRLGADIPKTLVPVNDKPMIFYLLEAVRESKITDKPVVVVGYMAGMVLQAIGDEDVDYAMQAEQLGTGHAVNCARQELAGADNVIVLYGDAPFLSAETLRNLEKNHQTSGATISLLTVTVPHFNDWYACFKDWGRILRNEQGEVMGIRELRDCDPDQEKITEVNPAIFCFKADWLWENIDKLKTANSQSEYYLTDLIEMAMEQGEPIATSDLPPEQSLGINTQEQLEFAEKFMNERSL